MIDLAKELLGTYTVRTKNSDAIEVEMLPLPTWAYFSGHFPQKPILPAVAMIDISQYFVQEMMQTKEVLGQVSNFRIRNPVVPNCKVIVKIQKESKGQSEASSTVFSVSWVSCEDHKSLADISLHF